LTGNDLFKRDRTTDMRRVRAILLAVLAAALLGGCSSLTGVMDSRPEIPEDPVAAAEALSVIAKLQQANGALKTFKGVGRLTVRHEGKVQVDERMAWVGAPPLKLSVVLFAASFPALRMAGDGEWLYYQDGQEPGAPVKRVRASDPDFKRILSIPIQASDIIALMCGRMPLKEHSRATIQPLASGGLCAAAHGRPVGAAENFLRRNQIGDPADRGLRFLGQTGLSGELSRNAGGERLPGAVAAGGLPRERRHGPGAGREVLGRRPRHA